MSLLFFSSSSLLKHIEASCNLIFFLLLLLRCRFISPIVIAPVTTIVGLGLLEYGFPGVGKCVEIGIPALLIILFISQYLKHFKILHYHFFELFPILFGVAIVWVYATILTVAGAYDHASALGQIHCRTDRSGLVSTAPW
jgi:xanthine/uracil permease